MFYVYMLWTFYVRFTHIRIMGMVQNDKALLPDLKHAIVLV